MPIGEIVTQGLGLNPGTVKFIVTRGLGEDPDGDTTNARWNSIGSVSATWSKQAEAQ